MAKKLISAQPQKFLPLPKKVWYGVRAVFMLRCFVDGKYM